ncbi:MAG: YHYH protein [Acidimicrobiia bacterium]
MNAAARAAFVAVFVVAYGLWLVGCDSSSSDSASTSTTVAKSGTGLTLDPNKNYGDEYADGILPVGDGKYTRQNQPEQGYVYVCRVPAGGGGGAQTRGPWFANDNTEYDINEKVAVAGNVQWDSSYTITITGSSRIISTNDLPRDHTTGVFPVQPSDPAYQYDRNPNSIESQSLTYTLDANPTVQSAPSCVSGEVGVMTTGVALFDAFDAGGRDAGAWEVQDGCDGHPQMSHEYHYHTLSKCIQDASVHTVIGFALDGFPITGPKVAEHNILTTKDLDECHGITSEIQLDGKTVTTYHYVMTQDFPYSASCFRGTAVPPRESDHQR